MNNSEVIARNVHLTLNKQFKDVLRTSASDLNWQCYCSPKWTHEKPDPLIQFLNGRKSTFIWF